MSETSVKFIDLFAGMGGLRLGFEQAFRKQGITTTCVLTSEMKPHAVQALAANFNHGNLVGDIRHVETDSIPDFDFLLAGFPCQAFSTAGKRLGFSDTRGTLFFEVERILRAKRPYGFLLENVEGLITHDKQRPQDKIGNTFRTILSSLENLGYKVQWKLLESQKFGVPQRRKRVFITGTRTKHVDMENFKETTRYVGDILEHGLPTKESYFTQRLLQHYRLEDLYGKAIQDKRGGNNNIHSWDFSLKGEVSCRQKVLLEQLIRERRKKCYAQQLGVEKSNGIPLTIEQISSFYNSGDLIAILESLVEKRYLTKRQRNGENVFDISSGNLSFEFNKILDPNGIAPTLVATDASRIAVVDGDGIRSLSMREGLRMFGYPETYSLAVLGKDKAAGKKAFDLLGNTVVVPVVEAVSSRLCQTFLEKI